MENISVIKTLTSFLMFAHSFYALPLTLTSLPHSWASPSTLSFATTGKFKPMGRNGHTLDHNKNPKKLSFPCSLKAFSEMLRATLLSLENLIMYVMNLFIPSLCMCGIIRLNIQTKFWVGVHLASAAYH